MYGAGEVVPDKTSPDADDSSNMPYIFGSWSAPAALIQAVWIETDGARPAFCTSSLRNEVAKSAP